MKTSIGTWMLALAALALAGCASPETECREGVARMKQRMEGHNIGTHTDAAHPAVQAYTLLGIAETQMVTGNFKGCNESLAEAAAQLRRSQGNNQQ